MGLIDSLTAARLQMTVSLAFHMIFAAVGIGLPLMMVIVEGAYLRTGKVHYKQLAQKWAKVTGLLFAVGAVSGTALSLELGLLWPRYMEILGAVVGHIFGLEGYAFFIEAIFIGLYLYGWDRLSPLVLRALAVAAPMGFIALEAGWFVTEVGRQPWVIHGVMRTADAVTPADGVPAMFAAFTALYLLLGVTVVVLLRRLGRMPVG